MSAVSHTVQVSLFIFLVTFALVLVLETVGEDALAAFLSGNQLLAVFASALVGLVPNCSASVVITQLYLEGVLGFAPLMAGLLTSAGVGYLVLFRHQPPSARECRGRGWTVLGCVRLRVWCSQRLGCKAPSGAFVRGPRCQSGTEVSLRLRRA